MLIGEFWNAPLYWSIYKLAITKNTEKHALMMNNLMKCFFFFKFPSTSKGSKSKMAANFGPNDGSRHQSGIDKMARGGGGGGGGILPKIFLLLLNFN